MKTTNASAVWQGSLRDGEGTMKLGSGYEGQYTFASRFEQGKGTNPEELIGAAHAGCFSMALSASLSRAGFTPTRIQTKATVTLDQVDGGFGITRIDLDTEAEVPGIDEATFQEQAQGAKQNCPVSKALSAVDIHLNARLVQAYISFAFGLRILVG
jgi:osmotically inducible protein OsmC